MKDNSEFNNQKEQNESIKIDFSSKNNKKGINVFVRFSKIFNVTTLVAFCALLVSLVTTTISYLHTKEQDIQNQKTELRALLQRMISLPKENYNVLNLSNENPNMSANISSLINQENVLLYNQAVNLINSIPQNRISAIECYTLASCLANSGNYYEALEFIKKALEKVSDFETELGAARTYAQLLFRTSEYENGRIQFEKTLTLFDKYKNRHINEFHKLSCNIKTELGWAYEEAESYNFDKIMLHINNAKKYLDKMPITPGREYWSMQIINAETNMTNLIPKTD